MSNRRTDLAYAAGWRAVRALPDPVARATFRRIADVAYRRNGRGVQRLRANLRRVVGADADLEAVTKAGMRSYLRYWCEVFRLPVTSRERITRGMHMRGEDRLRKSVAEGNGVICVLPHMGNWDHAGAWCSVTGLPFTTVAERLKPESLYERFLDFRRSLGMEVIPLTGGDNAFDVLSDRLRAGGMLCLLGDRDLTPRGIQVEFFGAAAKMPAGPALLALRTGATLLPATLWYEGADWGVWIHEAVTVPSRGAVATKAAAMTQDVARVFEAGIREHPEDWHMLSRLWLTDLADLSRSTRR